MFSDLETVFRKALEEDERASVFAMTTGAPEDFADYRELLGRIRGMRSALQMLDECVKKANDR